MAFPITADPLATALQAVQTELRSLKQQAQSLRNGSAAGPISANAIVEFYLRLVQSKARLTAAAAVPGIAAYARAQFDDNEFDIVAEFNAVTAQIDACGAWINTNMPKDGAGYLLKDQLTASGVDVRAFSSAQAAGLRTQLDALIATMT